MDKVKVCWAVAMQGGHAVAASIVPAPTLEDKSRRRSIGAAGDLKWSSVGIVADANKSMRS